MWASEELGSEAGRRKEEGARRPWGPDHKRGCALLRACLLSSLPLRSPGAEPPPPLPLPPSVLAEASAASGRAGLAEGLRPRPSSHSAAAPEQHLGRSSDPGPQRVSPSGGSGSGPERLEWGRLRGPGEDGNAAQTLGAELGGPILVRFPSPTAGPRPGRVGRGAGTGREISGVGAFPGGVQAVLPTPHPFRRGHWLSGSGDPRSGMPGRVTCPFFL